MNSGKNFLKVCGILMIISGGVSVIFSGFVGLFALLAAAVGEGGSALLLVLTIIAGVMELVCGIIGVVNCSKPEKAGVCLGFGAVVLVLSLVTVIWSFATAGFDFISLITSVAVPVLFVIGAVLNKKGNVAA